MYNHWEQCRMLAPSSLYVGCSSQREYWLEPPTQINHLLPEHSSIPMNADYGLVPEEVHPHAEHGANCVEEGPSVLHLAQLSATLRVGVPVGNTVPDVCIE